jgi:hypothetical protein
MGGLNDKNILALLTTQIHTRFSKSAVNHISSARSTLRAVLGTKFTRIPAIILFWYITINFLTFGFILTVGCLVANFFRVRG